MQVLSGDDHPLGDGYIHPREPEEPARPAGPIRRGTGKTRAGESSFSTSSTPPPYQAQAGAGEASPVMIAVMGMTGTGKSTFIKLISNDDNIRIGHGHQSETANIQATHYVDEETGRPVVLIDTPGFDDSREGVSDTDVLENIAEFLEPEKSEGRKLNGIIYMHRISDPRLGGVSRKNLRMFQSLCGKTNLRNVRIVTTNWSRVTKEEGDEREEDLRTGAFKPLINAGAQMRRHENNVESAQRIMSELIPLRVVTMQIQRELREGKTLAETSAGTFLTAEMEVTQKNREKELENLKAELEDAARTKDDALKGELADEVQALQLKLARVEEDMKKMRTKRRGLIGNFVHDMIDVVDECVSSGKEYGAVGGLSGLGAGLVAGPVVATMRAIFGT